MQILRKSMNTLKTMFKEKKQYGWAIVLFCALGSAITLFCLFGFVEITVKDSNVTKTVQLRKGKTAGDAIAQAEIEVAFDSYVSHDLHTKITSPTTITIYQAREVIVGANGTLKTIKTALQEPQEIFKQAGIPFDATKEMYRNDEYDTEIYYQLAENEKIVESTKTLPYKTVQVKSDTLRVGTSKTTQKGQNGKAKTISLYTQNKKGDIIKKTNLLTQTTQEPIDREIAIGTKEHTITANGKQYVATKKITVEATAYCSCSVCCGPYDGTRTADGSKTKMYHTVAAPSTYAFGTMLYFPYFQDAPNGGVFEVEDRGGAIQGNRIDIYFSSHEEALAFGRKTLEMYVLE